MGLPGAIDERVFGMSFVIQCVISLAIWQAWKIPGTDGLGRVGEGDGRVAVGRRNRRPCVLAHADVVPSTCGSTTACASVCSRSQTGNGRFPLLRVSCTFSWGRSP